MSDKAEVLREFFDRLVRAGVTITYEDWAGLDIPAKVALTQARENYRAEGAAMLATAMSGPVGAAWVMRNVDDGESFVGMHLEFAVDRHMERAGAK